MGLRVCVGGRARLRIGLCAHAVRQTSAADRRYAAGRRIVADSSMSTGCLAPNRCQCRQPRTGYPCRHVDIILRTLHRDTKVDAHRKRWHSPVMTERGRGQSLWPEHGPACTSGEACVARAGRQPNDWCGWHALISGTAPGGGCSRREDRPEGSRGPPSDVADGETRARAPGERRWAEPLMPGGAEPSDPPPCRWQGTLGAMLSPSLAGAVGPRRSRRGRAQLAQSRLVRSWDRMAAALGLSPGR